MADVPGWRAWALGAALSLALAAACLWSPQAARGEGTAPLWRVDYDNSRIAFTGRQMWSPVVGGFASFSAEARFDPERLDDSSVVVVVDVTSVETPNPDIEQEIKRGKWFDIENHPQARFETVSFRRQEGDRFEAVANLTIKGVTKEIVFPFELAISEDPARPDHLLAKAAGEVEIRRLDFGIGQGQWRDTNIVANEVTIRIEVAASRAR